MLIFIPEPKETEKRNIKVINSPGANANAVAEFVVGLMIMLLAKFINYICICGKKLVFKDNSGKNSCRYGRKYELKDNFVICQSL